MKKILLVLVFIANVSILFAQKSVKPDMPIDDDSKIVTYKGVVEISGVSKSELYKRANNWFKSYYVNPTQVIQLADSNTGKIEGKAQFTTYKTLKNDVKAQADLVKYTITIDIKEGKFRYSITKINLQAPSYKPIESYFSEADPIKDEHWSTLKQADDYFIKTISFMREGMDKPSSNIKKDEW